MFNKVILKGIKIRRTLIALALLGGSLAVHADREDSLQSYNYAMHATSIQLLQRFIISWLLSM